MAAFSDFSEQNKAVLEELSPGDLVEIDKILYAHWGVYIGDGFIIHLTGVLKDDDAPETFINAKIRKDLFLKVAGTWRAVKNNSNDDIWAPRPPDEIVAKATEMLGKVGYNLFLQNCEHFANTCRYNKNESFQVKLVSETLRDNCVIVNADQDSLIGDPEGKFLAC